MQIHNNQRVDSVDIDSESEILNDYYDNLEAHGYTVVKAKAPVIKHNEDTYVAKIYKESTDDAKVVSSFMVGNMLDPNRNRSSTQKLKCAGLR